MSSYRSNYNFSTEPTSSRLTSLSSSSFRPSYTSGSYRSPRTASNVSAYISRYSSLAAEKEKDKEREKAKEEERRRERERERELREKEREKERDREKDRLIETSRKLEAELDKDKPKLIKKSALIAAKYGSAVESEDSSKTGSNAAIAKPKKDNAPPVTFTTRYGKTGVSRDKSREPSPASRTNSTNNLTVNRPKGRDPSPAGGTISTSVRSRDPSPATDSKRLGGYTASIANKFTANESASTLATNQYKRQTSGSIGGFLQNRARSRDPSPTVRTITSREPSPVESKKFVKPFVARSRDPSPNVSKANVATIKITLAPKTHLNDSSSPDSKKFINSTNLKTGIRSRDPSPVESKKIPIFTSSKLRSRDPSPAGNKPSATFSSSSLRTRTCDSSPAATKQTPTYTRSLTARECTTLTLPVTRTRDPSPSISKVRSRDPSPALSTSGIRRSSREHSPAESVREKYGLNTSSYRPYGRSNSTMSTTSSRITMNSSPVPALSYMTSSEAIAARTSRPSSRLMNSQSHETSQCPSPLLVRSHIFSPEPVLIVEDNKKEEETSSSSTESTSTEEESSEETESSVEPEPKIFVEITLVTRGTSPTPPGSTPYIRARRAEMCKTIEKTIQKQILNVQTDDKAIQSDRMDDPTRHLRYHQPATRTWSPFLDSKYSSSGSSGYTRYSSASSRYSRDSASQSREPSVCSTRSDVPEKKDEKISTLAARVKELNLSKSVSPKYNSANSRSSTSTPSLKQKTPPKQKSPEKPPPAPTKDGSPTKPAPNATSSRINKDFRKSALNMGPAPDRPRKGSNSSSKSSSSSGSTATQVPGSVPQNGASKIPQVNRSSASPARRSDRSSSTSSEVSTATTSSISEADGQPTKSSQIISSADETGNTVTDSSVANNELLMRAIQLATNFVNGNRNTPTWYDNNSTTSATESLNQDQASKSGWEAGTHYMESIKDDDSTEDEEDDEETALKSGLQQATWWNNDNGFIQHPPVQAVTVQDTLPNTRSLTYRIRHIQSGEKAWWMTEDKNQGETTNETSKGSVTDSGNANKVNNSMVVVSANRAGSQEKAWWLSNTNGKLEDSCKIQQDERKEEASSDDDDEGEEDEDEDESNEAVNDSQNSKNDGNNQPYSPFRPIKLTKIESGEKAWWMMSTNDVPAKAKESSGSESKAASKEVSPEKKNPGFTMYTLEAEDQAWWEEAMADLEKKEKSSSSVSTGSSSSSKAASKDHTPEPKSKGFIISRARSGEKAWWMCSTDKVNEATNSDGSVRECSPVKAKPFKITRIESGEAPWWMAETENAISRSGSKANVVSRSNSFNSKQGSPTKYKITRVESGEKPWWMDSPEEKSVSPQKMSSFIEKHGEEENHQTEMENEIDEEIRNIGRFVAGLPQFPTGDFTVEAIAETPLGDRASPEGVEDSHVTHRTSPYDNIPSASKANNASDRESKTYQQTELDRKPTEAAVFISRHTNIDDLLGGSCHPLSPTMDRLFTMDELQEISPHDVRVHDSTAQFIYGDRTVSGGENEITKKSVLDDAALQVYKDGDYGAYLDLESSLAEQSEEIEGLNANRKNSLVVRTQLSVRVHSIIEKLLSSEGRELRRALFSLKQIFQEDKDLVHGFVALGGLICLVQIGNEADQNYQNYILRALGQVMLYVDGMNGVMKHAPTIQWLYSLIASKYRLVVKTALKLLLVFVEYCEGNCYLMVSAIRFIDTAHGVVPWNNIMRLLKDYENADTELLIYATSLVNKTLSGLSDQDSFYDESDFLEQQGMEGIIQRYMSRPGTDLDLLDQLQLYETVLRFEDGETDGIRIPDNTVRKTLRYRSNDTSDRRKSRRHSTGTAPVTAAQQPPPIPPPPPPHILYSLPPNMPPPPPPPIPPPVAPVTLYAPLRIPLQQTVDEDSSSSANSADHNLAGSGYRDDSRDTTGVTPGLRRRRERAERQKTFMREQQELSQFKAQEDTNGHGYILTQSHQPQQAQQQTPTLPVRLRNGHESRSTRLSNGNQPPTINEYDPSTRVPNLTQSVIYSKHNSTNYSGMNGDLGVSNGTNGTSHDPIEYRNSKNLLLSKKNGVSNGTYSNGKLDVNGNMSNGRGSSSPSELDENESPNIKMNGNYGDINGYGNGHVYQLNGFRQQNGKEEPRRSSTYINGNGNGHVPTNGHHVELNGKQELLQVESDNEDKKLILQLKKDHTVKDLTQKLSSLPLSPQEDKPQNRIGDMSGLISKAKEGLAKSKSNKDISRSPSVDSDIKKLASEQKKSENELHWEEIVKNMTRKLNLCDLDFTDLTSDDDKDVLAPRGFGGAVPPPPPPGGMMPPVNVMPPPPSMMMRPPLTNLVPPMYPNGGLTNPAAMTNGDTSGMNTIKKNKKTVKLFWKEVREDMIPTTIQRTIWDELPEATVDTQKLEHLFESRAKDLMTKKQQELNKNKEIIVLDHKRSNAINIAMTKLPPPRAIKAAILKMDSTVVTREGIEKLLNMLPTDEERCKIQEAQMLNPELPLGTAEQFLLTLSSISELGARLKLWAFKLDFENIEKEIAEPLMDLKQGIELLKSNLTFKCILSTLLKIGIFLNGAPVKGFQIDYLAKVPEVKDTVHKHSLLHHLCHMVMETQANTTDLYSEIGPITRASKADFGELAHNVTYLETECKASWDRLKLISKHDTAPHLKQKLIDFLADCAERIIILSIVHRRVQNRYRKFLLWLGVPQHRISESRPNEFCRIVSEFALEYRTTRERVQQQIEKKANHRERNKTRGKLIVDVAKFKGTKEDRADVELRTLLGTPTKGPAGEEVEMSGTLTWRRRRGDATASPVTLMNSSGHSTLNSSFTGSNHNRDESFTDGDDEILESLVKTATKASTPRPAQRERKRTRQADRKSLRRTLKNGLTEEEKQHVASLIKGY
ncbi:serine-rich adhesin for platelets isoform X2 [Topomyia yanbarensis]|uniref:serine-rich adhesin for platelets isoform X2 n=1 Tax=Topomyia yanbarensis TaxID=2498891 RepID=UPI00273CA1C5|nr:serine-rich adhesin for platelets isoform X2 [Topomyia yanbarensis]